MEDVNPEDAGLSIMLDQMTKASDAGLYFAALVLALTIPDMCSALGDPEGKTSGPKYKAWVEEWMNADSAGAASIWVMRCKFLHEGKVSMGGTIPIAFIEPTYGTPQLHNLVTNVGPQQDRVMWLSIPSFVIDVARGVAKWWDAYGSSTRVQQNLEKFVRRRPEGLPPHVGQMAVIC